MSTRPVCLIIRDGYGWNEDPSGNAVMAAATPNDEAYMAQYPHALIDCSGEAVGLPEGYQGSSEVGHLNMGAGRIVIQELKRIDDGLASGALFAKPAWQDLVARWRSGGGSLHLCGLIQDEGVHAHQEHLFKIIRRARDEHPGGRIVCHAFLDGRDTPPRSCLEYLPKLQMVLAEVGNAVIGTAMGRYYAMDRSQTWSLTDTCYQSLVEATGRRVADLEAAIEAAYATEQTPDGGEMGDEYIPPLVIGDYAGIQDGDVFMHTNYRQDRAIQLTQAFVEDGYPGTRARRPDIAYLGLTRYYDQFTSYLLGGGGEGDGVCMDHLVGEVISAAGLRQLRIAETQKFRHVTSFFNGKSTTPYPGEDQVEVKGRFDPALFADHPEMDAITVTDRLLAILADPAAAYDFIAVNFANGDMVGHTGSFAAAVTACETVDACLGRLVPVLLEQGYRILVTADHGNAEQMLDPVTGRTKTSHSLNPVQCIYIADDTDGKRLVERGKLADIGRTVIELLDLPVPPEMTGDSLFA